MSDSAEDEGSRSREVSPPPPDSPGFGENSPAPASRIHRMTPPIVPVDLITPRYQKKTRTSREMKVTDSSQPRMGTTAVLQQRTTETLSIRHAGAVYHEEMRFRTYAVFRHGRHRVLSNSVGYSSDGDLVMVREDVSQKALLDASPGEFEKRSTAIVHAVCLNPSARRPLTDTEQLNEPRSLNAPRFKKYPGIRCPKNKKLRNRLMNDHWATEFLQKIHARKPENDDDDDDDDDDDASARPAFPESQMFQALLHREQDEQFSILEKKGVSPTLRPALAPPEQVRDPNSAEVRFLGLSAKLKEELFHALSSEFLTQQVADLDRYFSEYLRQKNEDNVPLRFVFRDGYCRLVCHGVAEYYQLVSRSSTEPSGLRVTLVSRPSKRSDLQPPSMPLLQLLYQKKGKCNTSPPIGPSTPTGGAAGTSSDDGAPPLFNLDDPIVYDAQCPRATTNEITQTQKKKLKRLQKQMEEGVSVSPPLDGNRRHQTGNRKR